MRKLYLLLLAAPLWAASFNITGVTILGTSGVASTSACLTAGACNGWVAEIQSSSSVAAAGTYALGISGANNSPASAKIVFTISSTGYKDCSGSTTTITRTVYGTHVLRQPYNTPQTNDDQNNGSNFYTRIALSDVIYSGDTISAVSIGAGFYTDGSGNTTNTYSGSVTNNSTLAYATARTIANWSRPGWQRATGATLPLYAVAFQRHPMFNRPVACVQFSVTDGTTTNTVNVSAPTIDTTALDHSIAGTYVQEYIGAVSTSGLIAKHLLTANFKAYPWVGDSTAVMNSGDGVNSQPNPRYAPQYYIMDVAGTYGTAAAYVDSSANVPGVLTSGTFVAGEKLTQTTSGAIAYLIAVPGGAGPLHVGQVVSGTPTALATWVGGTSGAVFTPTATPASSLVGSDSSSCAVAEASWNPGSPPSPCATINGGAVKLAAYNNSNSSRNDVAGTIYLNAGYYNWLGSSAALPTTTGNVYGTVTPISGVTASQVVIQQHVVGDSQGFGNGNVCTSGTTLCGTPVHLKLVTVNVQTAPVSIFNSITYFWLDQCNFTVTGTAPIYNVTDFYETWNNPLSVAYARPFSTVNAAPALVRGNVLTSGGSVAMMAYTVLGNTTSQSMYTANEITGGGAPASNQPIIAFNSLYSQAGNTSYNVALFTINNNPLGAAFVENISEWISTSSEPLLWITADGTTQTPVNNIMIWYNTIVGNRVNRSYNSAGSAVALRQAWHELGELREQQNIKSDTFTGDTGGAEAARVGNWGLLYGVGSRGNYDNESTGIGAAGSFQMEFTGIYSYAPAPTCGATNPCISSTNAITVPKWVNRAAYNGSTTGAGNGNYRLYSSSPASNMLPCQGGALPYDLDGQIRNASCWGAAGAYEIATNTQVMGF